MIKHFRLFNLKISKTIALSIFLLGMSLNSSSVIPRPDHVVICILENHSFSQVIGVSSAPYINSLVSQSASLEEYYALTHPSQPNYLMMFSGSNQGETTDNLPVGTPWTTPNLGASLLMTGYTFAAYSEDLPTTGSTVATSGAYARKHCPWVNWQGNGPNQIPASCNLAMDQFPTDFTHLPDVSFVIPNQNNDMHNGADPAKISVGDSWVQNFLKPYTDWAQTHNSLLILTFDEDNFTTTNRIMLLFSGEMVQPGAYTQNGYNHYDLLRTIEDMFALPHAGNAGNARPITEIWKTGSTTGITDFSYSSLTASVYPNPLSDNSQITISNDQHINNENVHLVVYDIAGRKRNDQVINLKPGKNKFSFSREGLAGGIYTYQLLNEKRMVATGRVVVE